MLHTFSVTRGVDALVELVRTGDAACVSRAMNLLLLFTPTNDTSLDERLAGNRHIEMLLRASREVDRSALRAATDVVKAMSDDDFPPSRALAAAVLRSLEAATLARVIDALVPGTTDASVLHESWPASLLPHVIASIKDRTLDLRNLGITALPRGISGLVWVRLVDLASARIGTWLGRRRGRGLDERWPGDDHLRLEGTRSSYPTRDGLEMT